MHPVLARRIRLDLYLAAWIPVTVLVSAALAAPAHRSLLEAAVFGAPLTLLAAFMSVAQWPMCRSLPLDRSEPVRFVISHAASLVISVSVWVAAGAAFGMVLQNVPGFALAFDRYRQDVPLVAVLGGLLFFAVTMLHYLMISFEDARDAERAALEAKVQARDAELRALRAQINPHFLFNGLNAVASLAGSDPMRARQMCVMLSDFLRRSLALGGRTEIELAEELDLADRYLEIERVRFGERLWVEREIDTQALHCIVPALVLQPLVENAVTHGVAQSLGGGTVRIVVRRVADRLEIEIDNPAEPDRPPSKGSGLGVANVRSRLASLHPGATRVECREADGRFWVELHLPAIEPSAEASPAGAGNASAMPLEVT